MAHQLISSNRQRALVLFAGLCVITGGALFIICEWTTGVGVEGVVSKLFGGIGVGVLGLGTLIIGIMFARSLVVGFVRETAVGKRDTLRHLARQFGVVLLNIVIYGGIFIVAMGGLAALDGASIGVVIVVLFIWALCITGFVAYRHYRKAHAAQYGGVGMLGMTLFMLVLGAALFLICIPMTMGAVQDLRDGPKTADVFLVDARIDHPSWRYRLIVQEDHVLTFYTADDERIVLEVPENDINEAKVINDYGNFVNLTYFSNTQVFCSASPWLEGRQIMSEDLLSKLNEEYDFEL